MRLSTRTMIACCVSALFLLILWTVWGNTALTVTEYTVPSNRLPEAFSGFRIAQISDLHNAEFGKSNKQLLDMLRDVEPDIILLTGDLVDSRKTDIETAIFFAAQATSIAPCYYVPGNHEARLAEYEQIKASLKECGVTVLENQQILLEENGSRIALLGIDDPSFYTDYLFGSSSDITEKLLMDIPRDKTLYTVLLAHRPEFFQEYTEHNIDLIFSGHAHGGQFRLPVFGDVFAPNQGFFPQYDAGLFTEGNTSMIVSRGVGNSIIPFRFNNRPEIVIAQLVHAQ